MPSGRPQGRNDPSLISSLETAVRQVRRPGPVELAWNWRIELATVAAITGMSLIIVGSIGLIGLAAVSGAGLPDQRPGLVRRNPAPGAGRLRQRLGADQERQAPGHLVGHANGLR